MVILGIDPGFGRIGYGIINFSNNQYKIVEYGCITTPENSYFPKRLNKIEEDLETILLIQNKVVQQEFYYELKLKLAYSRF